MRAKAGESLVDEFDVAADRPLARGVQVREIRIDDREPRVRKNPAENQRGPREQPATDDGDPWGCSFEPAGARQQLAKRALVRAQQEPLQRRRSQRQPLEQDQPVAFEPTDWRRPAADARARIVVRRQPRPVR